VTGKDLQERLRAQSQCHKPRAASYCPGMDSGPAVCASDLTTIPSTYAATAKRGEAAARHAAAVAQAREAVQRAQAALATAMEHLRRAQDVQKEAQERLRRLEQATSRAEVPAADHGAAAPNIPSAASAVRAMPCAIGAASTYGAQDRTSCKQPVRGSGQEST